MSDDERKEPPQDPPEGPSDEETVDPRALFDTLGLDPQEVASNPFGAVMKMMTDPKARSAMESFISSPQAQTMLNESMQNPMIRQMLQNNPMLKGMAGGMGGMGGMGGLDLGSLLGGGAPMQPQAQPAPQEEVIEEEEEAEVDEPVIELLTPPHGGEIFPNPSPIQGAKEIFSALPESMQPHIDALAMSRAKHHLGKEGLAKISEISRERVSRPIDLLMTQGAFAGEVAWYAICRLEEDFGEEAFTPLARHALRCVTFASAYRTPSFLNQLLVYLCDVEQLNDDDLKHGVWALSAQPKDGQDGVFEIEWEDVDDLVNAVPRFVDDPELIAAFLMGLLGWKELDHSERPRAWEKALKSLPKASRPAIAEQLASLVGDAVERHGIRAGHLSEASRRSLAEELCHILGLDTMLSKATEWRFGPRTEAHAGLLQALDLAWAETSDEHRGAYLKKVLTHEDTALRRMAFEVAAAWEPHQYLELASEDPARSIRRWAEKESSTLNG